MRLEDIKSEVIELNGYERYQRYKKHSKHLKRTTFWHVKVEHWTDEMFLEFYKLTELDVLPTKKVRGMQKGTKRKKGEVLYKANGVIMNIKQIKKTFPNLVRSNIDGQIKRKGYFQDRKGSIYITREN